MSVTPLRSNIAVDSTEPDPDCIRLAERVLDDARAGRLQGFAMAGVGLQGEFITAWKGNIRIRDQGAVISLLHHRFFDAWNRQEELG